VSRCQPAPEEHVSVNHPDPRRRRAGVICHVDRDPQTVTLRGLRVSSVARMFVELASMLPLVDLVVIGDHVVRKRLITLEALLEASQGCPAARAAASYVRENVDSPMETRLRMLIVLAGIPEPEVNLKIRNVDGVPIRRYDLCRPEVKVIVEYDGRHHVEVIEQWESDLKRREAIDEDAWRILVMVAADVYNHPDQTVERVFRLLRARRLPGLPKRPSDGYRPHFPGREAAA
jgi:hypothetical protein